MDEGQLGVVIEFRFSLGFSSGWYVCVNVGIITLTRDGKGMDDNF